MKTEKKEGLATAGLEVSTCYVAPAVEVMEVDVELGFAVSDPYGDANTPGDVTEDGPNYEF